MNHALDDVTEWAGNEPVELQDAGERGEARDTVSHAIIG